MVLVPFTQDEMGRECNTAEQERQTGCKRTGASIYLENCSRSFGTLASGRVRRTMLLKEHQDVRAGLPRHLGARGLMPGVGTPEAKQKEEETEGTQAAQASP